ncbi:MAG: ComF family protein [Rhodopseudomonas palustris]|uniref:ComF family protein n=1 Tax=Rhodopseudomonas palustris TaxID=1076 RepID=A0A933VVZ6_RHOPL|nr:ComF family protein [Rhodopseudomonas palustris]
MQVSVRRLMGNWDVGYALHTHVISSVYLGRDEHGRDRFDNTRSEPGEALFQLKYRSDWAQVQPLAEQVRVSLLPLFPDVGLIVPMPASVARPRQPVTEIARELGRLANIPVFETIVTKASAPVGAPQLKNLTTKEEKAAALVGRFTVKDVIGGDGKWNALLLDDLFDTGASMEAVCDALRTYPKIGGIYVGAITQGRNS